MTLIRLRLSGEPDLEPENVRGILGKSRHRFAQDCPRKAAISCKVVCGVNRCCKVFIVQWTGMCNAITYRFEALQSPSYAAKVVGIGVW